MVARRTGRHCDVEDEVSSRACPRPRGRRATHPVPHARTSKKAHNERETAAAKLAVQVPGTKKKKYCKEEEEGKGRKKTKKIL